MIYYITGFLHGFFNSVNRMTNVQAGKYLGTANGALINYIEATLLSLFLIFTLGHGGELSATHIASVPWWVYLGAVVGLVAQLMQIVGTLHTNALISSVLTLCGNLGMAVVLDYFFYGSFSALKVVGIALVLCGTALVQRNRASLEQADEQTHEVSHEE